MSAAENNKYEIVDVTVSTSPAFFENLIAISGLVYGLDSSAADCATGIALATVEEENPAPAESRVYLADLVQATFTAGTNGAPGSWSSAGAQVQTLTEANLMYGASGIAVAQGTYKGRRDGGIRRQQSHGDCAPRRRLAAGRLPSAIG